MAELTEYPPPVEGEDEVARAKLNLLQLASPPSREPTQSAVNQHPYGYVVAALVAGVVVGKVPLLRRLVIKAATWGMSAYAQRALRQWKGKGGEGKQQ